MFKICLDATPIREKPSGVGVYTFNLIKALDQLQASEDFKLDIYFQPTFKNWLSRNFSPNELIESYSPHCLPIPVTVTNALMKFPNPLLAYFRDRWIDLMSFMERIILSILIQQVVIL